MNAQLLIPFVLIAFLLVLPGIGQEGKAPPAAADVAEVDPFAESPPLGPGGKLNRQQLWEQLPKLIQVQVEWIEMDHATLTQLMFMRDPKGDSTAMRLEVQKLVEDGKAEILETSIAMARPGQRATVQSVREHIYPTEYDPAGIPQKVHVNLGSGEADTAALSQLSTPPNPTAFEVRNVGTTLEIEPNIGVDARVIDLRLAPEIVAHTGESDWQTMKDSLGGENQVRTPLFYALQLSTALTLRDGQYRFAGVQSPRGDDGETDRKRKILTFVRCDVLAIGEEDLDVH